MSKRLTESEIIDLIDNRITVTGIAKHIFDRIEADREAVRAETREELLRDHFKIGDEAIGPNGELCVIAAWVLSNKEHFVTAGSSIRRPAKKRPTTRAERVESLRGFIVGPIGLASDGAVEQMCRDAGIALEVDE